MTIKFEAKKPNRFHSGFLGVEVKYLWYSDGKWTEEPSGDYTNLADCKTLRAFRRMLRKNPKIRGRARLIHQYIGFDVFA